MYARILVTLEHTAADDSILAHVRKLAKHCGASVLLVLCCILAVVVPIKRALRLSPVVALHEG